MILVHDVNSKNKDYQKLKNLYHKSFPKIEKLPFSVLRVMALKPNIDFWLYMMIRSLSDFYI